jgi:hypothetical protein
MTLTHLSLFVIDCLNLYLIHTYNFVFFWQDSYNIHSRTLWDAQKSRWKHPHSQLRHQDPRTRAQDPNGCYCNPAHFTPLDSGYQHGQRPIVVRDYLEGSPMLLLLEERARLAAEQTRSRRQRRLLEDSNDADSDGSQGDRPSHTSVSLPSSYHDASPNPASFSAHPQPASAPTTPFGTQVPGSTASSE